MMNHELEGLDYLISKGDLFALYRKDVDNLPVLTPREMRALATRRDKGREALIKLKTLKNPGSKAGLRLQDSIRNGKCAVQEMVEGNLRLVMAASKSYLANFPGCKEEIIAAGNLGLTQAAKEYKPELSQFSTYAWRSIRTEVKRNLGKIVGVVGISVDRRETHSEMRRAKGRLIQKLERPPSFEDLLVETGWTRTKLKEVLLEIAMNARNVSLDAPIEGEDNDELTLADSVSGSGDIHEIVERMMTSRAIRNLVDLHTNAEARRVIELRAEGWTHADIGRIIRKGGASRSSVQQIAANTYMELRNNKEVAEELNKWRG